MEGFFSLKKHFIHQITIFTIEKYDLGKNFILFVKTLLRDQESCVINNGTTTTYFSLDTGTCQDDPISAFSFVLALEILFFKPKSEIASIGVLKGFQVAVSCVRCIDLNIDTLKILGTHFCYNKKLKTEKKL